MDLCPNFPMKAKCNSDERFIFSPLIEVWLLENLQKSLGLKLLTRLELFSGLRVSNLPIQYGKLRLSYC